MIRFRGLFEPHETPTGDRRMFAANKIGNRDLPLPLMLRTSSGGHMGAEVVAKIEKIELGPGGRWYSGYMLDPAKVHAVAAAVYLIREKLVGPSVDLDKTFTVEPRDWKDGKKVAYFTSGNVIGVTLVPMPAFAEVTIELSEEDEAAVTAALLVPGFIGREYLGYIRRERERWIGGLNPLNQPGGPRTASATFAIGATSWDSLPIAPREYKYDADDAVKRIAQWSGIGSAQASPARYASMFLWRGGNQMGNSLAQEDFRLPIGDIINGQPHLVYHAIYAAAALLSGAHGGLPNIPDQEKNALKGVINQIYPKMAKAFNDPTMTSPFQAGGQMSDELEEFAANPKEPYGDVTYADPGYQADGKKRYPLDSEEHCRAAWSYINMPKNAAKYSPEQLKAIKGRIKAALEKYGVETAEDEGEMALLASIDMTSAPPIAWFQDPKLSRPTPLTVGDDGRVFGHLGKWGICHVGVGDRCVMLPHSNTQYGLFKTGTVRASNGMDVRVGKITLGTAHAHPEYGIMPTRGHYDNSGWAAAVVNVGEDRHGVWVAGAVIDPEKVDELRRSPLSGDWRRYNGNLELVAALAVNSPGFPVFHVEDSEEFSLVAAGMVTGTELPFSSLDLDFTTYESATTSSSSDVITINFSEVAAEVERDLDAIVERRRAAQSAFERYQQRQRAARLRALED